MSRIGKLPGAVPAGVSVELSESAVNAKGPKGSLSCVIPPRVSVALDGDSILVTISDRFRNTQTDESRVVNMVLGKSSLNLEAPFSCDVTSPTSFMVLKRAPDIAALQAARACLHQAAPAAPPGRCSSTASCYDALPGTWHNCRESPLNCWIQCSIGGKDRTG